MAQGAIEVVKVGSSSVFADGRPCFETADSIASQIASRMKDGSRIALVSSGAIAFGREQHRLGSKHDLEIKDKQWLASVGQPHLINFWSEVFSNYNLLVGQILTTNNVLMHEDGEPNQNLERTMMEHFRHGSIPVLNENDSVATDEIKQGDNDRMSALVANAIGASTLYLMGTSPHIFDASGDRISTASLSKDSRILEDVCQGSEDPQGTGGALTKLEAMKLFLLHEASYDVQRKVVVASASERNGMDHADSGRIGTTVVA